VPVQTKRFAEKPAGPVSVNRAAEGTLAGNDAESQRRTFSAPDPQHLEAACKTNPLFECLLEFAAVYNPLPLSQPEIRPVHRIGSYADSLARPFRRLRLRTLRPSDVAIRARKPHRRWRLIFDG